jgi:preprotein translocase subunit YajC
MSLVASGLWPVLFAQDAAAPAAAPAMWWVQYMPLVMIGLLFFFMILRPQQREQQKRDALLKAIKKNDRVLTTGGMFGVVTNVQAEVNEVTIRIDEKNDTKVRLQLSSIARVLGDGDGGDAKAEVKS